MKDRPTKESGTEATNHASLIKTYRKALPKCLQTTWKPLETLKRRYKNQEEEEQL